MNSEHCGGDPDIESLISETVVPAKFIEWFKHLHGLVASGRVKSLLVVGENDEGELITGKSGEWQDNIYFLIGGLEAMKHEVLALHEVEHDDTED